jgi:hypothetical protein
MTAVENKLMMILMRLALLDSASYGRSHPPGTTLRNSQCEQETKVGNSSSSDIPRAGGGRANDRKPS